jgi:hypothetical protein
MKMELSVEEQEQLQQLEEDLWREETRFDTVYMEQLIAGDFFEFGRSGRVHQRSQYPCFARARRPLHQVGQVGGVGVGQGFALIPV